MKNPSTTTPSSPKKKMGRPRKPRTIQERSQEIDSLLLKLGVALKEQYQAFEDTQKEAQRIKETKPKFPKVIFLDEQFYRDYREMKSRYIDIQDRAEALLEENDALYSINHELEAKASEASQWEEAYETADEEVKKLNDELQEVKMQLQLYRAKAQSMEISFNSLRDKEKEKTPVLFMGDESDHFSGEIKDIILEILQEKYDNDMLNSSGRPTRRMTVLKSILDHNKPTGKRDEIREIIKKAFSNFRGAKSFTKTELDMLNEVGIKVQNTSTHAKVYFEGDERFVGTIATTSSGSKRVALNTALDITRTIL